MPAADLVIHSNHAPRVDSAAGVRLRWDTVYSNHKGDEKKSIRKRADKAIGKLQDILRKVLRPDEVVLYLARAQAPVNMVEQLTFGWYIYYVTGTFLVLTNRRLLHFLVKRDGSWKRSLRSVHWGDVEEAKVRGWLSPQLKLKYRNGKKETYWGLRRDDAKKINVLLQALLLGSLGEVTATHTTVSLCPECLAELRPGLYQCSQCHLTFKDEKTLIRRSLFIPGGGYFYTGHWFLAFGDFFAEAILLLVLAMLVVNALIPSAPQPGEPAPDPVSAWVAVGFVAFVLAVEKLLTVYHCRRFIREFMPAN